MDTPNVKYTRDEVTAMLPRWQLIRDCLSGEAAIKANDMATSDSVEADRYLPKPNATDTSAENTTRYEQYIERAVFYNVTQRTHAGLVGQVFQKDPVLELPELLEVLRDDVDGGGVGLIQQSKKTLGLVLAHGRAGLLADYPNTDEPSTRAQILAGEMRPTIQLYDPWSIINWRTKSVGAKRMLSLVVIFENYQAGDDGFEVKYAQQYRVLSLEESGIYRVGIWRQDDKTGNYVEAEYFNPRDSSGANLREIPFQFVGSLNNDPFVDLPPLYDLASLNIAHYRNSADYEESSYICGQPTPWAAGLTQSWVDENFKSGVQIGSRAVIPLPQGGSCGLLQASPNSMPFEAMQAKERQMVALGAKLIQQQSVQRTLGEARLEYATEISVLGTCAKNVSAAYEQALEWCADFAGADGESTFELYPDFELGRMNPQEQAQLVASWQAKAITTSEMRAKMKGAGLATLDDEEYASEVESAKPDYGMGPLGSRSTPPPVEDQPAREEEQQ
jgi:hypothetical protein